MKIIISICYFLILLSITSCNNSKSDTRKMLKLFENYYNIAIEASKDSVLNNAEIQELNKVKKEINKFSKQIDEKYKNNPKKETEMLEYMQSKKNIEIINNYQKSIKLLKSCKGFDEII